METIKDRQVPENLNEAIDQVLVMLKSYDDLMQKYETEQSFLGHTHHFLGQNIRNNWFLWWNANHKSDVWPTEMPKLVKQFREDLGVTHADDMSGIILTSAYRRFKGLPEDLLGQVQHYKEFWAKHGE